MEEGNTRGYRPLEKNDGYYILIPNDIGRKYPALYLIHGIGGCDEWDTKAHLQANMNAWLEMDHFEPMVLIMPRIDYCSGDGPGDPFLRYCTTIPGFVNQISQKYEGILRAGQENRAIAGFSMGGAAALYYAVKHPGLFWHTGAFSPSNYLYGSEHAWIKNSGAMRLNTESGALNFIGHGGNEDAVFLRAAQLYKTTFAANGVPINTCAESDVVPGSGHNFVTFNELLHRFVRSDIFGKTK